VLDLQRRLGAAGYLPAGQAEAGYFCAATEAALRSFQTERGLRVDGVCRDETWAALVEASWVLGERLIYLTSPHLRGDDVAELQSRLGRLGFDCGRVDGIFGMLTQRALVEFQRNFGLKPDGICGRVSVRALVGLARYSGAGPGVAALREQETLRGASRSLESLRVVVGQFGGLSSVSRSLFRELHQHGAVVVLVDEPGVRGHADLSNRFGADVYLGIEADPEPGIAVAYYAVPAFESAGGRSLAERLRQHLEPDLRDVAGDVVVTGMRLPVLRETRMPAVVLTLGPVRAIVDRASVVASGVVDALRAWVDAPLAVLET
jgi:N-acetylmuramoyl-L-alanine amidase